MISINDNKRIKDNWGYLYCYNNAYCVEYAGSNTSATCDISMEICNIVIQMTHRRRLNVLNIYLI